jgi:hypothetical protein
VIADFEPGAPVEQGDPDIGCFAAGVPVNLSERFLRDTKKGGFNIQAETRQAVWNIGRDGDPASSSEALSVGSDGGPQAGM